MTRLTPLEGSPDPARSRDPGVEARIELFARLDAISLVLGELIDAGDPERLLPVLAERQEIIARLEALAPVVPRPDDSRAAALAALAARVSALDAAHLARLEARRDDIAGELAAMHTSRRAFGAYGASPAAPRFQDRSA